MKTWKAASLALAATMAFVIGLALTGIGHGLVLLAYVLFLAAVLFIVVIGRLRDLLPPAADFRRMKVPRGRQETRVEQFEMVKLWLAISRYSRSDLYYRLRPPVRDIVAARLSRGYGVDLEREPDRAASILAGEQLGGSRAWELVRPDYRSTNDEPAPGWSERELEQLIEELERL
jgi:hypothetical protein